MPLVHPSADPNSFVPDVAAIVVAYRNGAELAEAVRSVRDELRRADKRGEIVVIDNGGSTEGLGAIPDGGDLRVIHEARNLGFGAGVNLGFRATRAPVVLVLNPDAALEEGALPALLDALEAGAALAGPRLILPDGTDQESPRRFYDLRSVLARRLPWVPLAWKEHARRHVLPASGVVSSAVDWVTGAAMVLRRDAVPPRGPFDERFFLYVEDVDLCRRLAAREEPVVFVPTARVRHRFAGASRDQRLSNPLFWRHLHSALLYASRWHGARPFRRRTEALIGTTASPMLVLAAIAFGVGRDPGPAALALLAALFLSDPLRASISAVLRGIGLRFESALLAGSPAEASIIARAVAEGAEPGLSLEGYLGPSDAGAPHPRLGAFDRTLEHAESLDVDSVIFCGDATRLATWVDAVHRVRLSGRTPLYLLSGPEELLGDARGARRAGQPVVVLGAGAATPILLPLALGVGRLHAFVALVLVAPVIAAAALAAWALHREPPLVTVPRVGQGCASFGMWRLRSGPGAEAEGSTALWDRALRWLHIDELPQLWNVVRGEMALVGPRPIDASAARSLAPFERARFAVRPGISGLWQLERLVRWRLEEMIALDLRYVLRWSPALDVLVLLQTLVPRRRP